MYYVTPNFRELMLKTYPAALMNKSYLRMLRYLCFGTWHDTDTKDLVIARSVLADICHVRNDQNFKSNQFLSAFQRDVLPAFEWTERDIWPGGFKKKARCVRIKGFSPEIQEAISRELEIPDPEGKVSLLTGLKFNRGQKAELVAEQLEALKARAENAPVGPLQAEILALVSDVDPSVFSLKYTENKSKIEAAITSMDPESAERNREIIKTVREVPTGIVYGPAASGRTCRLSALGTSVLSCSRDVRKAWCSGWVDCDLRSSQFAIMAAALRAPLAIEFLKNGGNIWKELLSYCRVSNDKKAELKPLIYGMAFGKARRKLINEADAAGLARIFEHPMIDELMGLRRDAYYTVAKNGGHLDAFQVLQKTQSKTHPDGERGAHAVVASVFQSWEMYLLQDLINWFNPVEGRAAGQKVKMMLWQHDGCTLSFRDSGKKTKAQAELNELVKQRAHELGVYTELEFTDL